MHVTVFRLILCFLCVSSAAELTAQNVLAPVTPDTAGMSAGEKVLYYERNYFEAETAAEKGVFLLRKGLVLKNEKEYEDAYIQLKRSDSLQVNDSLFYHLRYETALCAYLSNDFKEAEKQLLRINTLADPAWRDSCEVLRILVMLEREQWAESKRAIIAYKKERPERYYVLDTTKLYSTAKELGLKNKRKAQVMSLVTPGLGQTYAGKPWRGLTSFVLVGGALTYGVFTVIEGYYVSGILTGGGVAWRFYMGGARYAGQLVDARNAKKKREYISHVKTILLK